MGGNSPLNRNSQTRMTNDQIPRNDQIRMTNRRPHNSEQLDIRASDFIRHSSFVIQRLMQIRFMVPMRANRSVGAVATRCGSQSRAPLSRGFRPREAYGERPACPALSGARGLPTAAEAEGEPMLADWRKREQAPVSV